MRAAFVAEYTALPGWPCLPATDARLTISALPREQARAFAAVALPEPQTAEHSSSSATRNEDPQPQAATTFGLLTWKPAPCNDST